MLNRVGVASSFAITASLLSAIAAVASTTGPTATAALPARAATAVPVSTVDARVRNDDGAPLVGGPAAPNAVAQPVPANSGPAPSTPQQPGSAPRPVSKPPATPPTNSPTNPPSSTPPTTAPSASPPPYNCAGSDDGMTEAYKHAREQYCQGGGE